MMVSIEKLQIGDVVTLPFYPKQSEPGYFPAEVIYIQKNLRYFTAEFEFFGQKVRESYCAVGPKAAWLSDGAANEPIKITARKNY